MPTEILRPNAFGASNDLPFGSSVSSVNDNSDSTWVALQGSDELHVQFPTPSGDPDGTQTFYIRTRPTAERGEYVDVYLYENNSNLSSLGSIDVDGFGSGWTSHAKTWSAASLGTGDGSLVECLVDRQAVYETEVADVWWDCNYVAGAPTPIEGSAGIAEADDSADAVGGVAVAGSADAAEADDALSAGGGLLAAEGTAAITEADDAVDASAGVAVAGSADASEAGDTTDAAVDVSVSGSVTVTEAGDTLSAEAAAAIAGTSSVTEDDDSLTGAGAVAISGGATLTEDDDALSASSGASTSGALDVTEVDNTVTAAGSVAIGGAADIGEAGDTLSGGATIAVAGGAAVTENHDNLDAEGTLGAAPADGTANITEGGDAAQAGGAVAVAGQVALTKSADSLGAGGAVAIVGGLDVTEAGDTLSAVGATVTDPLDAIENALSGISGVTIYRNRIRPIPAESLPAINIRWLRERISRFDKLDVLDRDASIGIIIKTDGDTADDQVDAWCEDIETAIYADATLSGLLSEDIELQSTGLEWGDGADKVYLTATMVWSARYATTEQDPNTPR